MPAHIPPGVQRLVARLGEVPLAVFTASWDLVTWSPLWAALLGEPVLHGRYPGDRGVAALVEELLASSERFRELWEAARLRHHCGRVRELTPARRET